MFFSCSRLGKGGGVRGRGSVLLKIIGQKSRRTKLPRIFRIFVPIFCALFPTQRRPQKLTKNPHHFQCQIPRQIRNSQNVSGEEAKLLSKKILGGFPRGGGGADKEGREGVCREREGGAKCPKKIHGVEACRNPWVIKCHGRLWCCDLPPCNVATSHSPEEKQFFSPCNFATTHLTACVLNFISL